MKKRKIIIYNYNPDTKELDSTETITTKVISDERLKSLIKEEIKKRDNCCYYVLTGRPKN